MKRNYQLEDKNYLLRLSNRTSRDPKKQCFDDYDYENEFSNLKTILSYRETGEKVMEKHISH